MALSVLKQCASAHQASHKESARAANLSGSSRPVLSTSEAKESCNTGIAPAPNKGKATKRQKGSFAQKRVVLPFDVVILPLAVFLCRVLEFLHTTAQTAHKLRDFAASEKQQYHEDNQNDLCRSNGSHPVDFGAKFGEKTSSRNKENAKVRQTPVSAHKINPQ
jgi:hypothetical protein